MFVASQRNIILPGPNGEKFRMPKGFMGRVPAWAENSAYLQALAADGKVIISDKDTSKKEKKPRKMKAAEGESTTVTDGEPDQAEQPAADDVAE